MNLEQLQNIVSKMEEQYPEPFDDCMWMKHVVLERIKQYLDPPQKILYYPPLQNTLCTLTSRISAISLFEDEDVPYNMVETGTYKIIKGVVTKVVRHRYEICKEPLQFP